MARDIQPLTVCSRPFAFDPAAVVQVANRRGPDAALNALNDAFVFQFVDCAIRADAVRAAPGDLAIVLKPADPVFGMNAKIARDRAVFFIDQGIDSPGLNPAIAARDLTVVLQAAEFRAADPVFGMNAKIARTRDRAVFFIDQGIDNFGLNPAIAARDLTAVLQNPVIAV